MKKYTLNSEQISRLIKKQYIEIKDNKLIEIQRNNLIVNENGNISKVYSIVLQFNEEEIKNEHIVKFIKNLICEHFNISSKEVFYIDGTGEEFDLVIHFAPNMERKIYVCELRKAILNMKAIEDDFSKNEINSPEYIGLYKKLGNSAYYFRWIDDIL